MFTQNPPPNNPNASAQASAWEQELHNKLQQGLQTLAQIEDTQIGITPKSLLYQEDRIKLYRYEQRGEQVNPIPILIVYALVNRPHMMDLQPDRSLVQKLLDSGQDVYLIDWGYPQLEDAALTLDDHINGYLHHCVEYLCQRHKLPAVNLLGVCQGGTLSLCYSALHPARVRNLVLMVTPVDFHTTENTLRHMCQHIDVDLIVNTCGNVPGRWLNSLFMSLKPFRLSSQKYVHMLDKLDNKQAVEHFLRMEQWIFDSPDQPGETFREFVNLLFKQNLLVKGELQLGGKQVDLKQLNMPILNIYALQDHIVPPGASTALADHVASLDYQERAFNGGHIGIYVSHRAQQEIPPVIAEWLNKRQG